ncbi:hypothetical protein H4218_004727 [Coemansia sp. IMI 209128]|nr:hypothetical protein H4218_004727 [Coemansia sp. IMI 209128]
MEKTEQRKTIVRFYDNFPSEGGNELSVHEAFELIRKTVYFTIEYDNSSKGRENELVEDDDAAEGDDDALDEGGEDGDDEHEDDD